MFLGVILASATLIILYNYTIDFNQKIKNFKEETKRIETESVVLKESLFNILSSENLKKVANNNGLIEDKNPTYIQIKENQWQIGLNF